VGGGVDEVLDAGGDRIVNLFTQRVYLCRLSPGGYPCQVLVINSDCVGRGCHQWVCEHRQERLNRPWLCRECTHPLHELAKRRLCEWYVCRKRVRDLISGEPLVDFGCILFGTRHDNADLGWLTGCRKRLPNLPCGLSDLCGWCRGSAMGERTGRRVDIVDRWRGRWMPV